MLSRIAAPNWSGPPEASVPSSNTITILVTTSVDVIGGNAAASSTAPQRRRIQALLAAATAPGGELQPTKWTVPSLVTTSNRGAPAPQCDPRGLPAMPPDFLMSYPSSLSVVPFTLVSSAVAAAKLLVGPVFTSSNPSLWWSLRSPVGHAASGGTDIVVPVVKSKMNALVGHPSPLSHVAWTRYVFPGSKSAGW